MQNDFCYDEAYSLIKTADVSMLNVPGKGDFVLASKMANPTSFYVTQKFINSAPAYDIEPHFGGPSWRVTMNCTHSTHDPRWSMVSSTFAGALKIAQAELGGAPIYWGTGAELISGAPEYLAQQASQGVQVDTPGDLDAPRRNSMRG